MNYKFVDTEKELAKSTIEFYGKPEFWRSAIGNAPKYFVHIQNGSEHSFGLSKFCAFKNITVEEYISTYRGKTGGGTTQKHISKLMEQKWISRQHIDKEIKQNFDNWITEFHPNYNLNNASFITLTRKEKKKKIKRKKFIDPKNLEKKLEHQRIIGEVGEKIAMKFELERLKKTGKKNFEKYIEHTSKKNSSAGFDILCTLKDDNRYIEVKSSTNRKLDFFITENEYYTLEELRNEAYIYFVHITDLKKEKGTVFRTLKNPIKELKKNGSLTPIVYKATLKK